jgi:hypothetical protein
MFRAIFYLLLTVVVITVLKSIVGIVLKGVAEAMKARFQRAGRAVASLQPSPAHWRAEERSGLWNLHRRGHFDSRKRWEARPSISAPRSAAISTLLRWLASPATPSRSGSYFCCAVTLSPAIAQPVFYKDVLPILQKHCQECHRPAKSRPCRFSLMPRRGRGPSRFANKCSRAKCRPGSRIPLWTLRERPLALPSRDRYARGLGERGRTRRRSQRRSAAARVAGRLEYWNAR